MNHDERARILALLEEGRIAVPASVAGITDEQARHIPASDASGTARWSILGCVEHIGFSEDYLFAQLLNAVPSQAPLINLTREEKMLARGTDRSRRMESPPAGHPRDAFASLQDAVDQFLKSRDRTIAFVRQSQDDLRARTTWHPLLGDCNSYEMLISICVHALRHVKQIEEIKLALA